MCSSCVETAVYVLVPNLIFVFVGRNSPPLLEREDNSHSRKGKSRGGKGGRGGPSTSGGRGRKNVEVREAELGTKREGSGRRGRGGNRDKGG